MNLSSSTNNCSVIASMHAIVTGGSSGYGRGIAAALRQAGATVWITGRNQEKLANTAREIDVHPIVADVTSGSDWDNVFHEVGGDIDILVNNAGAGGRIAALSELTDAEIISIININLTGAILGCARAAKIMTKKSSGIIINISSVCALYAWPAWSVYTASKAGLAKFSHGLFTELRPHGVRVVCVTPSWGQTDFNNAAGITGAAENPELVSLCTSPDDLGAIIRQIIEIPAYLAVPDITIQPMIQEISPM